MKRLTTLISALFLLTLGVSQVWALPDCPKDVSAYWDNCYGSAALNEYGDEYRGDWKDDKRHGQGSLNYIFGGTMVGAVMTHWFILGPSAVPAIVLGLVCTAVINIYRYQIHKVFGMVHRAGNYSIDTRSSVVEKL